MGAIDKLADRWNRIIVATSRLALPLMRVAFCQFADGLRLPPPLSLPVPFRVEPIQDERNR